MNEACGGLYSPLANTEGRQEELTLKKRYSGTPSLPIHLISEEQSRVTESDLCAYMATPPPLVLRFCLKRVYPSRDTISSSAMRASFVSEIQLNDVQGSSPKIV